MSEDHRFVDLAGDAEYGRETMRQGWATYMNAFPQYMIHIGELFVVEDEVLMVGRTTGSHLGLPRLEEFRDEPVIWVARIGDGLVTEWRLHADTPHERAALGMTGEARLA